MLISKLFLEKKLTVEEVMAQVFIFFSGGFDTTSSATSFALFELAKNFDIQRKLQEDIDATLAKHNNEWTYDCIQDMKYLDQVFEETLRMYPSVPLLRRTTTKKYTIPDTNVTIDKGTSVIVSILSLQRNPLYFPNPDKFDPDRFTPDAKETRIPLTYFPFADGPRNCIGMRYAQLQAKMGLASILSKFNLELGPNQSTEIVFDKLRFFGAEGGLHLKVSARNS